MDWIVFVGKKMHKRKRVQCESGNTIMDFNRQRKFRSLFADFKRTKFTEIFFLLHSKRVNRHSEFHWVKGVSIATKMAAKQ